MFLFVLINIVDKSYSTGNLQLVFAELVVMFLT